MTDEKEKDPSERTTQPPVGETTPAPAPLPPAPSLPATEIIVMTNRIKDLRAAVDSLQASVRAILDDILRADAQLKIIEARILAATGEEI